MIRWRHCSSPRSVLRAHLAMLLRAARGLPAPAAAGIATSGAQATMQAALRGPSAAVDEQKVRSDTACRHVLPARAAITCTGWCMQLEKGDVCRFTAGGRTRPKEIALKTEDRTRSRTEGTSSGSRTPDDAETVTARALRERVCRLLAARLRLHGPFRCKACTEKHAVSILLSRYAADTWSWRRTGAAKQERVSTFECRHNRVLPGLPRSRPMLQHGQTGKGSPCHDGCVQ